MEELGGLEGAIRELEARRAELGDAVTDAALAPLRERLAALGAGGLAGGNGAEDSLARAGERKLATLLFADFAGFTRLVSSGDPEEVRELVTAAFEALVPAVERFGGTLEKFIGDAIMAIFGVPRAHGDEARRACLAALAMREALRRFNLRRGAALELHFGLGTGLVVAGRLGLGGQQGYSAVGNAVNRAARIAALAPGGEILVDEETRRLGGEGLQFRELEPARLKGFAEPVALFRLEGEAGRACVDEGLPFVGRESELSALLEAWGKRGGAGACALVCGEAGIGKTRLGREAAARIRAAAKGAAAKGAAAKGAAAKGAAAKGAAAKGAASSQTGAGEGPRLLEFRIHPEDRGSAQRLWRGLLGRLSGARPAEAASLRREKLSALLSSQELSPAALRALSSLGPVSEDSGEEDFREEEGPGPGELASALLELLGALAAPAGLLLLLDGLEHLDPASKRILEAMTAVPLPAGLFLLLLSRELDFPLGAAPEGQGFLKLRLGPLSAEESRELAEALSRKGGFRMEAEELERAGGNPLFLEELLARRESLDPQSIPSALFGLIAARIDALPATERESARAAAVLGERFPEELLFAVGGGLLAGLLAEGILVREGEGGILSFRHPLFRETIYASLLGPRRRELHARAARAIKELYPEYAMERPELLAEHWRAAGEGRRALPYYKSAGTELLYRGAVEAALEAIERGLALARESGSTVYLADFLALRGRALGRRGEPEAALAALEEALGLQRGLGNLSRLIQLQRGRAYILGGQGRLAEAEALLREALELAGAAEARKELARLGLELAYLLLKRGELGEALKLAREGLQAAEKAKQLGLYRKLLRLIGDCLAAAGSPEEAGEAYRRAARAFELSGEPEEASALEARARSLEEGRNRA